MVPEDEGIAPIVFLKQDSLNTAKLKFINIVHVAVDLLEIFLSSSSIPQIYKLCHNTQGTKQSYHSLHFGTKT